MKEIKVKLDIKYYLTGKIHSTVKDFASESHLGNYLRFMRNNELESKIIDHQILEQ